MSEIRVFHGLNEVPPDFGPFVVGGPSEVPPVEGGFFVPPDDVYTPVAGTLVGGPSDVPPDFGTYALDGGDFIFPGVKDSPFPGVCVGADAGGVCPATLTDGL